MIDSNPSLLILSGVRGDTRRYRTFHLYEQSMLAGLDAHLSHTTDPELRRKVEASSLVVLHRASFDRQVAWMEKDIHARGGLLIQDIDDLLFEPDVFRYIDSPDFADPIRSSLYLEDMRLYQKTVEVCDAIMVSTDYLADYVRQHGKPVWVHRNAFSLEMLACSEKAYQSRKRADGRNVIGYASGTPTHNQDFAQIKPALKAILNKFPKVELWLVGAVDPGKDWGALADRIHDIKLVPWRLLPGIQAQFNINLAPLRTDNPFGQSKSEIKYVEAALVRVPTIASPSEAFKYAIRHGENGFLAGDAHQWESALEGLILDPGLRQRVGESAFQDVLQRYHPAVRSKELIATLCAITGRQFNLPQPGYFEGEEHQPFWSCAQAEQSPSLVGMGWYALRHRGFSTLARQVWIYFRRLVAPVIPYRKVT